MDTKFKVESRVVGSIDTSLSAVVVVDRRNLGG